VNVVFDESIPIGICQGSKTYITIINFILTKLYGCNVVKLVRLAKNGAKLTIYIEVVNTRYT
jgi:hypothetical protein